MTERSTPESLHTTVAGDGTLLVTGPIDAYTVPELEHRIESWYREAPAGRRVLDVGGVSVMTAAGVRLLLCTHLRHPDVRMRTGRTVERVAGFCHVELPTVEDFTVDDVSVAAG